MSSAFFSSGVRSSCLKLSLSFTAKIMMSGAVREIAQGRVRVREFERVAITSDV